MESILGFRVIDFRVKKIICVDGLEFINFTNYTVKKTDVFLGKDQALITGLTCSSKNSVNMFMSLSKLISYFYVEVRFCYTFVKPYSNYIQIQI